MIHEAIFALLGIGVMFDVAILMVLRSTLRDATARNDRYASALLFQERNVQAARALDPEPKEKADPEDGRTRPRQIGLAPR